MLEAAALNGLMIWIMNIINWFRRVWYALHHAIVIPGICETLVTETDYSTKLFSVNYYGMPCMVKVPGRRNQFGNLGKGETAGLLWIPGRKRAMLSVFKANEKSRKIVLICDVLSLLGLVLLIAGFVVLGLHRSIPGHDTSMVFTALTCGSIILMIAMSIIRKTQEK